MNGQERRVVNITTVVAKERVVPDEEQGGIWQRGTGRQWWLE